MGQKRLYINWSLARLMMGIEYKKGYYFEMHFLFVKVGIGLTDQAEGFGVWRA